MKLQKFINVLFPFIFRHFRQCVLVFVCIVAASTTVKGEKPGNDVAEPVIIEMNLEGELLKDVVFLISKQTGYKIAIDSEWAEKSVFGLFQNVGIEQFFRRVLKEKNILVISNYEDKTIRVRLFGDKELDNMLVISGEDADAVDPLDGQKVSEIKKLQADYDAQMESWRNSPNAVDPMDGQRVSEIAALQAENDVEMEKWKNDPEAVDPIDGQKLSEVKALQKKNDLEMEVWENDSGAVDPMDGQKISEIKALHAKNDAEMELWRNDPEAVDPIDGQKLSEIRAIQAEYNDKLK